MLLLTRKSNIVVVVKEERKREREKKMELIRFEIEAEILEMHIFINIVVKAPTVSLVRGARRSR